MFSRSAPDRRGEAQHLLSRELRASVRLEADPAALSAQIPAGDGAHDLGVRATSALAELSASGVAVSQFALVLDQLPSL